jgi:hypothetical protein
MKQFIVLLAVLPVMLLFAAQFILEQQNEMKISLITDIVYEAKEEAKQLGGFDTEALRTRLSESLGVEPSEIVIEAPGMYSVKRVESDGSRGVIRYKVIVPLHEVTAGKKYLGIQDEKTYGYKIEAASPSEYLGY